MTQLLFSTSRGMGNLAWTFYARVCILPTSYPSNNTQNVQQQWHCSGANQLIFDDSSNYGPSWNLIKCIMQAEPVTALIWLSQKEILLIKPPTDLEYNACYTQSSNIQCACLFSCAFVKMTFRLISLSTSWSMTWVILKTPRMSL